MKEKLFKIYHITISILISIYFLISLIFVICLPKYHILFPGWWTLLIIVPSLGRLIFQNNKLSSFYMLIVGIMLLLSSLGKLTYIKCFTILLCLGIIFIGISIVMNALKLPKKKDSTTYFPFYYTFLGSTEEKIVSTFKGANTKAVFGYLNLNLEEANIENNSTLRVLSMWGETEILVPENVEVITTNTNIFGGTENGHKKTNSKGKKKTLYIESTSVFGSTKIK